MQSRGTNKIIILTQIGTVLANDGEGKVINTKTICQIYIVTFKSFRNNILSISDIS